MSEFRADCTRRVRYPPAINSWETKRIVSPSR